MKIVYDQADFDAACAYLAQNNRVYKGDPELVAIDLRASLREFKDRANTHVAMGGYVLLLEGEEDNLLYVSILVHPGVANPYRRARMSL